MTRNSLVVCGLKVEARIAKGRGIAPLIMLIFSRQGCARNIVMVRVIPDPEI